MNNTYYCNLTDVTGRGMFGGFKSSRFYDKDGGDIDITIIQPRDRVVIESLLVSTVDFHESYIVGWIAEDGTIYPMFHQPTTPGTYG